MRRSIGVNSGYDMTGSGLRAFLLKGRETGDKFYQMSITKLIRKRQIHFRKCEQHL